MAFLDYCPPFPNLCTHGHTLRGLILAMALFTEFPAFDLDTPTIERGRDDTYTSIHVFSIDARKRIFVAYGLLKPIITDCAFCRSIE